MKTKLVWGSRTLVMGILNLTPDSFSGDGLGIGEGAPERAVEQARRMVAEGADILDLGAESSRPGARPISVSEELERLLPALRAVRREMKEVILSVDTYKKEVVELALDEGADWINDIWGLRFDPQMAEGICRHDAGIILMHNGRALGDKVETVPEEKKQDTVQWVKEGLEQSLKIARQSGIKNESIILDVGIGFGKTVEQNLELINRLDEFRGMGFPILVGPSRKSFIGAILDLPPDQRLEGTAAAVAIAIARGADVIRVHDVRAMVRVAKMSDAILARS